jgi:hypothetical protein
VSAARRRVLLADAFEVAPAAVERAFDPLWLRLPDVDAFPGRDGERPVCGCVTTRTGGWTGIWAAATAPARLQGQGGVRVAQIVDRSAGRLADRQVSRVLLRRPWD